MPLARPATRAVGLARSRAVAVALGSALLLGHCGSDTTGPGAASPLISFTVPEGTAVEGTAVPVTVTNHGPHQLYLIVGPVAQTFVNGGWWPDRQSTDTVTTPCPSTGQVLAPGAVVHLSVTAPQVQQGPYFATRARFRIGQVVIGDSVLADGFSPPCLPFGATYTNAIGLRGAPVMGTGI